MALIKQANLNAVRVHAHLTHPAFYEACNREGVLVWQDFPLRGYEEAEPLAQEAQRQVRAMMEYCGAHPRRGSGGPANGGIGGTLRSAEPRQGLPGFL